MKRSIAERVREKISGSSDRFWRAADFEGSRYAVDRALARLTASGELRRVRRGLYWKGSETVLGMAPPSPESVAWALFDEHFGLGPAGLNASLLLGLSTQVPRDETLAVPGRPPTSIRGIRFVSRNSRARIDEKLTPQEVAVLEVLRDWHRVVESPSNEAVERLTELVRVGAVRSHGLARASRTEPARVRERLRAILHKAGRSIDADRIRPARDRSLRSDSIPQMS